MAVRTQKIALSQIDYDHNPKNDTTALQNDIKQRGLLNPIQLRRNGDRFSVLDGQLRCFVYSVLGYREIQAFVYD